MWGVSLALKMTLRTDYYADAERFEIQGEEGTIQVTPCSDRILDEPAQTAREGRRVIAMCDLFQRSNAERRALAG